MYYNWLNPQHATIRKLITTVPIEWSMYKLQISAIESISMDCPANTFKGKLIVFEGIDRSGKSSQIKLLSQRLKLQGINNEVISFPDRTTAIGQVLNKYLVKRDGTLTIQALHLLFSANRWEITNRIASLLEIGIHVITDRYAFSGIAYSVGVENLDFEWCKGPDTGLIEPNIVFFMDIPPTVASKRGNFGDEVYENVEKLERVNDVFCRFRNLTYWKVIDALEDVDGIHQKIYSVVERLLKEPNKPRATLNFN